MKSQLPFSFHPPEHYTFANFLSGNNSQLIYSLNDPEEKLVFLWGEKNAGKTHLLLALTWQQQQQGGDAIYLSLADSDYVLPEMLQGLEDMPLVCLDDVHAAGGQPEWELGLFHFFNRIREKGNRLVLAADNSAINLQLQLADLKSRLSWGLTYHLIPLDDHQKRTVLKLRAQQRGFELSDEVAAYLLSRATRDMSQLMKLLDQLDYATLAQQRKLTIPFIKKFL